MKYGFVVRFILTIWYAVASTHAIPGLLEQIAPQTKVVASADFPCAHHQCGCRSAEQCRLRCCCTEHQLQSAARESLTVTLSAHAIAQCVGHPSENASTPLVLKPHLPAARLVMALPREAPTQSIPVIVLPRSAFRDPPEKIPLASA